MKVHEYKKSLIEAVNDSLDENLLGKLSKEIYKTVHTDSKVIILGNGGSSATASHFVCDLQKTVLGKKGKKFSGGRISAICLNDNTSVVTAWANDDSYEEIFSQQLLTLGKKGDLLISITGSGNSPNVLNALKVARKMKIKTWGLLGFDGGKAKKLCDDVILIKSNHYGVIEDLHVVVMHMITDLIKEYYK